MSDLIQNAENEVKAAEEAVKAEVAKAETAVVTEAEKVRADVVSEYDKAKAVADKIATLIKQHVEALNLSQKALDEAHKLINDAKLEADEAKEEAIKLKNEAELFVANTGGFLKRLVLKIWIKLKGLV